MPAGLATTVFRAATNGIEFAKSKEYSKKAAEAGLRFLYYQFDGVGNEANSHRHIGNLFDVKLRGIENAHEAGIEIVLVTTLVNDVNNDQVGPIIRFAMDNPKKIAFIAFQPVSFTGRDEEVTDERRLRQRYTLSHLAYDVKKQTGMTEPTRDWFPLSLMGAFAGLCRPCTRSRGRLGSGQLRVPSQLRCRHRRNGRQRDQGLCACASVSQHSRPGCRYAEDHRRRTQQELFPTS